MSRSCAVGGGEAWLVVRGRVRAIRRGGQTGCPWSRPRVSLSIYIYLGGGGGGLSGSGGDLSLEPERVGAKDRGQAQVDVCGARCPEARPWWRSR